MRPITYGSLFTGVGGFDLGFDRAGMKNLWQCEFDRSCQKLLRSRWPNSKLHENILTVAPGHLDPVDLVCGGSPCQDLSVAGRRAGMAGERSGLFFRMVGICKHQRRRGGARWIVWENVDGAFSSNEGRDFAAVLRAFTGVQVEVPEDGWGRAGFIKTPFPAWRWNCAWRLFDAQYFGVAQRRRRVFLVASAGDGSCAEVLFEPESLRGDPAPSRSPGEGVAPTLSARTKGGGGLGSDFEIDGGCIPEVADCLQERDAKGPDSSTKNGHLIPIAFSCKDHGADAGHVAPTLRAMEHRHSHMNGGGQVAIAIQEVNKRTGKSTSDVRCGIGIAEEGDPMFTLQAGAQHGVAVASAEGPHPAIAFNVRQDPVVTGSATGALDTFSSQGAMTKMAVRRLTPTECERLMSFPDGHTAGFADTVRYRMLGNAVVANVAEWIGKRIVIFR